jgi:Bacterial SH3 domain
MTTFSRCSFGLAALLSVSAVLCDPAAAQLMREHNFAGKVRGFHGGSQGIMRSFQADQDANEVFRQVLAAVGLGWISDRILLRASDVPDAEARYDKESGERFIFYNATFMQQIKAKSGNYWPAMSILAHEIGHHLAFHVEIPGRNHEFELEADYFSGFVLGKLGATLDETQAAMRSVGGKTATETHPAVSDRLQVITIGWTDGRGNAQPRNVRAPGAQVGAPASAPPAPVAPVAPAAQSAAVAPPKAAAKPFHFVDDARPPDAWLALRTEPGSGRGQQLARLNNGTLVEVLERRPDNWWRLRLPTTGQEGWALQRQGDRVWIHCCR